MGYMTHDWYQMQFGVKKTNSYLWQSIFHHIAITIAFVSAIVSGYALPGICCLFLIAELSTIFLNYVDMFREEQKGGKLDLLNKVLFFIAFTVTRVLAWPWLQYLIWWNIFFIWSLVGVWVKIITFIGVIQCIGVMLLNMWWYYLIIKKLVRMIKGTDVVVYESDEEDDQYINSDTQDTEKTPNKKKLKIERQ